jgi:hypothetical protein
MENTVFCAQNTTFDTDPIIKENSVIKIKHVLTESFVSTQQRHKEGEKQSSPEEEDMDDEEFGEPELQSDEEYEQMNSEDKDQH